MTGFHFEHVECEDVVVARADSPDDWQAFALVAGAIAKTAHAYAHGRCVPVADGDRWAVLAPGAVAAMARPEAYFRDDGRTAARAAVLGERVRCAMRSARRGVAPEEHDHPFAFVAIPGVPAPEVRTLTTLATLALNAAANLAGPVPEHELPLAWGTRALGEAPDAPHAGLLATRLDRPDAFELETIRALHVIGDVLIDAHPGLGAWIPPHRDPTVRIRTPAGTPGLPLAIVPFTVTTEAALRALPGLVEGALDRCVALAAAPVH